MDAGEPGTRQPGDESGARRYPARVRLGACRRRFAEEQDLLATSISECRDVSTPQPRVRSRTPRSPPPGSRFSHDELLPGYLVARQRVVERFVPDPEGVLEKLEAAREGPAVDICAAVTATSGYPWLDWWPRQGLRAGTRPRDTRAGQRVRGRTGRDEPCVRPGRREEYRAAHTRTGRLRVDREHLSRGARQDGSYARLVHRVLGPRGRLAIVN